MVERESAGLMSEAETVKAARERRTPNRLLVSERRPQADFFPRGVLGLIVTLMGAGVGFAGQQSAAPAGAAQDSKDVCAPVLAAYRKTASATDSSSKATNTGALNVAEAYETITTEAGNKESCKYLRDEALSGEDANVYSDAFASKSGTAKGTVWISKKNGWVLKREVDVELVGVGKGKQVIVFEYARN